MPTKPALFAKDPDNACQEYKNLFNPDKGWMQEARQHCEDLWEDYHHLADDHFLTEFSLHFHARWFEMYLAVSLIRAGHKVTSPKCGSDGAGPDMLLTDGNQNIWIEAVCSTSGESGKPDSVPKVPFRQATKVPMDKIALRLRSSLQKKADKYKYYLEQGLVNENDILVIAINTRAVNFIGGYPGDLCSLLEQTLYERGNPQGWMINNDTDKIFLEAGQEQSVSITKANGAEVNMQPFINASMSHITAVLGSCADAANRPNELGDDFMLFPNPTAKVPWPKGLIQLGEEWSFKEDDNGGYWQGEQISYVKGEQRVVKSYPAIITNSP